MSEKKVLIAEDDAALRRMLISLLQQIGIDAVGARDGLDAVNQLRESPYDLAIIDVMMPRLDGYSVVRYLEQRRPETHAIVVSALRFEDLDDLAQSVVVDAILHKPFELNELTAKIRESLERPETDSG